MSAVIRSIDPMGETIEIDEGESARAALTVFNDMVDGGCSLQDALTAVYTAGIESITGKAKRRQKRSAVPPCPYDQIIGLYHQHLPMFHGVRALEADRKAVIRKRWVWIFQSKLGDKPRATTREEALAWLTRYFLRANDSDFLMGKTERAPKHAGWKPDIDYVMSSAGLKQIIERTEAKRDDA